MIDKVKMFAVKTVRLLKQLDTILMSLFILLLFGYALLQINDAVDPTPSTEVQSQAELEQISNQVKYDQEAIEKIKELVNVESEVGPSDSKHPENPFEY